MRPNAVMILNLVGLLTIWGLLEAPDLAAVILIAIALALPAGLFYEARRGHISRDIAVDSAWWSAPFVLMLGAYVAGAGVLGTLAIGLAVAGVTHILRAAQAQDPGWS
jgi:hypothetical protein